jgi:hypothetical protein
LHAAVIYGHVNIVEMLVNAGAEKGIINNKGEISLKLATRDKIKVRSSNPEQRKKNITKLFAISVLTLLDRIVCAHLKF